MTRNRCFSFVCLLLGTLAACNTTPSEEQQGILTGKAKVLVDETIEPIIEDQVDVFQSSYTNAELTLVPLAENEVIHALLKDSAEIAVMARALTDEEMAFFKKKTIYPKTVRFATDAIALIRSRSDADSVITADEVIQVMQGKEVPALPSLVFDNANSSTVAYFKKLAKIEELPSKGVYALKSNADVLKYVTEHPQSVGVLGINWIAQPTPELAPYIPKIRVLAVKNQEGKPGSDGYYKPSQSNLALNLYPFTRSLYCINVQGKKAVGFGFSAFLYGERGQRLILKSGLLPDSIPPREIIIREQ